MSTQERRARNKCEPRFHRKYDGGSKIWFDIARRRFRCRVQVTTNPEASPVSETERRSLSGPRNPSNRRALCRSKRETAVASPETAPGVAAPPADALPIGLHAIAAAYSDYTKKSLDETRSFVEKLSGVRSFDKAMEVQTEFAKQAYDTFVAESQKMRELYGKLALQTFKPLEGFVTKSTT